jgi:hypothetical protein
MRTLARHKMFVKDMRDFRLTDTQATKLFLYVAKLLSQSPCPKGRGLWWLKPQVWVDQPKP